MSSDGRVKPRNDKAESIRVRREAAVVRGNQNTPSLLLVAVQLGAMAYLALGWRIVAGMPYLWLEVGGTALMLWALATMRLRQLRVMPEVAPNARLITGGPYRFIRHPMYTGALILGLAWLLDHFTVDRLVVYLVLVVDLVVKLRYEERLLTQRFPAYPDYCRHTKRLLPFLFLFAVTVQAQDYRVIMWTSDNAYQDPSKLPLFWQRLRELGVNTAMVTGNHDPQPVWEAGFPYYVENIVNRGLCLKWNSKVRDWNGFVENWKKTRTKTAFVREYCLDDPQWRAWACDQMRAVARRHKDRQPFAYDIRDELSVTISANPFDYCFCPTTLAAFRTWLKTQYADLAALNRQWETQFATWDGVLPFSTDEIKARQKRGNNNFAPWCDFRTYMDISLASALAVIRRAAREIDPRTPVGIEGTQMPNAFGGYDLWRLSQVLDWVEPYDIAGARAIFGSFMPGKLFLSTIGESDTNKARRRLWHLLLEGDRGCIVWWSEDCFDWKSPDLALTPKGQALAPVFKELTGPLARLFLRAERLYDPVTIHYSQPSIQVDWLLESVPDGNTWVRRFSSYEAQHNQMAKDRVRCLQQLREAGFTPRFATTPPAGQTFLMVGSRAMSDAEIKALPATKPFADTAPGIFDEHGTPRASPPTVPLVTNWTVAVKHLVPEVRVTPSAAVYRYRLGNARLLAFERSANQQMGEDLKVAGGEAGAPTSSTAQLTQPTHIYDLRTGKYLGHTDRFIFLLHPWQPSLFALLPQPVAPDALLPHLMQ
jgi:protein-S-isoprenylcysteine O-methyltransferase Ste14